MLDNYVPYPGLWQEEEGREQEEATVEQDAAVERVEEEQEGEAGVERGGGGGRWGGGLRRRSSSSSRICISAASANRFNANTHKMSLEFEESSSWALWAASHELPQELIDRGVDDDGTEQGWPPGMMDDETLSALHDMGIKNTRFDVTKCRSFCHHRHLFLHHVCCPPQHHHQSPPLQRAPPPRNFASPSRFSV